MQSNEAVAVEVKRRRHLDEAAWREVIGRFPGSGLTLESFCRQERVCVSSYRRWRDRLSGHEKAPGTKTGSAPVQEQPAGFIDLGAVGAVGARAPMELRLDLGGGMSLHLVRG